MTDTENTFDKRIPGAQLGLTGEIFAAPESGWFGTDATGTGNGSRSDSNAPRRQRTVNTFFGSRRSSTHGEGRPGGSVTLSALRSQMQLTSERNHHPNPREVTSHDGDTGGNTRWRPPTLDSPAVPGLGWSVRSAPTLRSLAALRGEADRSSATSAPSCPRRSPTAPSSRRLDTLSRRSAAPCYGGLMEDLFGGELERAPRVERVVMSLDHRWLELMFAGEKTHEFRKRFVLGVPVEWYVYLTAPTSRLAAIIDLDPAVEGTPEEIGAIAEQTKPGNGASVEAYLAPRGAGVAVPIRRVREYRGFPANSLAERLGAWHPPQGYMRVSSTPALAAVCDELPSTGFVREMTVEPPVPAR